MDLEYPNWQEPLAAAILEFNPQQLREKLQTAEHAIARRIQELGIDETSKHELRLLYDALSLIRGVKHDRLDGSA